jgi:histidyl-tRNA synthetase
VGFGSSPERIILGMKEQGIELPPAEPLPVLVAHFGGATKIAAVQLAYRLRGAGIGTRLAFARRNRSIKSQMREANSHGARYVLIVGEDEVARGMVTVRPLDGGEQTQVALADVAPWLRERLGL